MDTFIEFVVVGLVVGSGYSLVAVGFTLIFNASGILNFAQGGFVMLGGVLSYVFWSRGGSSLGLAVMSGIAATTILSLFVFVLVVRPLRARNAGHGTMTFALFGTVLAMEALALLVAGPSAYGYPAFTPGEPFVLFGAAVSRQSVWVLATALVVALVLTWLFRSTTLGWAMRAVAMDREAARLFGINEESLLVIAFVGSAFLGAVGGAIIAPQQFTAYDIVIPISLKGFAAAVIGGFGHVTGAIVGGLVLGVVESLLVGYVSSAFGEPLLYLAIVVILILLPSGVFSSLVEE